MNELSQAQELAIERLRQNYLAEPAATSFLVEDPPGLPALVTIGGLGQWRVRSDGRTEPWEFVTPYSTELTGTPWPIAGHWSEGGYWRCELGDDGFWYKRERVARDPETGEWRIVERDSDAG